MFIEVDKEVSLEQLLKGMIIQSGNDASVALAEHIAGSEETFANLMNNHAHRLGMLNSHFVNSTGLPDENHYTTPADIVKVSEATIREFPEYYPGTPIGVRIQRHQTAQPQPAAVARQKRGWRKTGHTEAAGYCLVASAQRESMRLTSVVMGTSSEDAREREPLTA